MMMMSLSQSKTFDDTRACFFDSFRFFFSLGFGPNDVNDDERRGTLPPDFYDDDEKRRKRQTTTTPKRDVFILNRFYFEEEK